jgi:hypothetical protein
MPQDTPLSVLSKKPGATSQVPSLFKDSYDGKSLSVSLDNNKMEMAGPIAVRMATTLERIEDNLAFE